MKAAPRAMWVRCMGLARAMLVLCLLPAALAAAPLAAVLAHALDRAPPELQTQIVFVLGTSGSRSPDVLAALEALWRRRWKDPVCRAETYRVGAIAAALGRLRPTGNAIVAELLHEVARTGGEDPAPLEILPAFGSAAAPAIPLLLEGCRDDSGESASQMVWYLAPILEKMETDGLEARLAWVPTFVGILREGSRPRKIAALQCLAPLNASAAARDAIAAVLAGPDASMHAHAKEALAHRPAPRPAHFRLAGASPAPLPPDPAGLTRLAEGGHIEAQAELGFRMHAGEGLPADPARAVMWLRRAADGGSTRAKVALAWVLLNGKGVPADFPAARALLEETKHVPRSMELLGELLEEGIGCAPDLAAAAAWYRKSGEQGNAQALFRLARLHESGRGVARDSALADQLDARAEALGSKDAAFHRSRPSRLRVALATFLPAAAWLGLFWWLLRRPAAALRLGVWGFGAGAVAGLAAGAIQMTLGRGSAFAGDTQGAWVLSYVVMVGPVEEACKWRGARLTLSRAAGAPSRAQALFAACASGCGFAWVEGYLHGISSGAPWIAYGFLGVLLHVLFALVWGGPLADASRATRIGALAAAGALHGGWDLWVAFASQRTWPFPRAYQLAAVLLALAAWLAVRRAIAPAREAPPARMSASAALDGFLIAIAGPMLIGNLQMRLAGLCGWDAQGDWALARLTAGLVLSLLVGAGWVGSSPHRRRGVVAGMALAGLAQGAAAQGDPLTALTWSTGYALVASLGALVRARAQRPR